MLCWFPVCPSGVTLSLRGRRVLRFFFNCQAVGATQMCSTSLFLPLPRIASGAGPGAELSISLVGAAPAAQCPFTMLPDGLRICLRPGLLSSLALPSVSTGLAYLSLWSSLVSRALPPIGISLRSPVFWSPFAGPRLLSPAWTPLLHTMTASLASRSLSRFLILCRSWLRTRFYLSLG